MFFPSLKATLLEAFALKTPAALDFTNLELSRTLQLSTHLTEEPFTPPAWGTNTRNKYPATNKISHLIYSLSVQPLSHSTKSDCKYSIHVPTGHERHNNVILEKFNWQKKPFTVRCCCCFGTTDPALDACTAGLSSPWWLYLVPWAPFHVSKDIDF